MNFKNWPVLNWNDFQFISVDAVLWSEDVYTAVFNFNFINENMISNQNNGFSICTEIYGENLYELYDQVLDVLKTGFFDGVDIDAVGKLLDADGNELEEICWDQWAIDDDIETTSIRLDPPPLLQ